MTEKHVAPIKTLARYKPDIVYIGIGEYVDMALADDGDYYLAADVDAAIEVLRAEMDALEAENEKLRKEVEEWRSFAEAQVELRDEAEDHAEDLAKSLAGLITWIPSADTYRRLGFDPEAPMLALKRAKLSIGSIGGLRHD